MNGLPLRGDEECTDMTTGEMGGGLFLSTYSDLLFVLDPDLATLARRLPKNAKYTSPEIQNDVIDVLVNIVKERIASECRKSGIYTVMMDGSETSNHEEMETVVVRYWKECQVEEHAITVTHAKDRSAKGLLQILLDTLEKCDILLSGLVSDCFDGASVNSGWRGIDFSATILFIVIDLFVIYNI